MSEIFFISGVARSGNTLLAAILSGHSEVIIPVKTVTRGLTDSIDELRNNFSYDTVFEKEHFRRTKSRLNDYVSEEALNSSEGLLDCLRVGLTSPAAGGKHYGDKVPGMIGRLEDLALTFPNAKFIVMQRDPRAVVASMKRNQGARVAYAANIWRKLNILAEFYRYMWGEKRVMLLKYEFLIKQPEAAIRNVCSFLNLNYEHDMLQIKESEFASQENAYLIPDFDEGRLKAWENDLTNGEILKIERITHDVLLINGYELSSEKATKYKPGLSPIREFCETAMLYFSSLKRGKFKGVKSQTFVDIQIPFTKRLGNYLHNMANLILSQHVVRVMLFRKNKYLTILR